MAYALDDLGWLQFERVCDLVLEREAGIPPSAWTGRADRGREALLLEHADFEPPVLALTAWARPPKDGRGESWKSVEHVAALLRARVRELLGDPHTAPRTVLIAMNAPVAAHPGGSTGFRRDLPAVSLAVFGPDELGAALDAHADVRLLMPSVLGVRDEPLWDPVLARASTLDVDAAQELARVFVPTRTHTRALRVLKRHRFVVLTGAPEMGKTAIARMIALARMTEGWEAHECSSPDALWDTLRADRPQVFVADDAFGSTEYRPDAAERWARELDRILSTLDDRHWLIWTSRPAPLKAGLGRVHRERGTERFPRPAEVQVDASGLRLAEKAQILLRHAKAAGLCDFAIAIVRNFGEPIVGHPHFTPERIRRFVAQRLPKLVEELPELVAGGVPDGLESLLPAIDAELTTPTAAMTASFDALAPEHRALLVALLDAPGEIVSERELAAAVRRHAPAGMLCRPAQLIDPLTDHFVRVAA